MILNALEGRPLPVYGDGQQIRDWLYVGDHCRGDLRSSWTRPAGRNLQRRRAERADQPDVVKLICSLLDARVAAQGRQAVRRADRVRRRPARP